MDVQTVYGSYSLVYNLPYRKNVDEAHVRRFVIKNKQILEEIESLAVAQRIIEKSLERASSPIYEEGLSLAIEELQHKLQKVR